MEDFQDGTVSANDCFRPVSRYYDRISRPEQLLQVLPRALQVLTDPAQCGPVTLSICQDVQAQAFDYPVSLFQRRVWIQRRQAPDATELEQTVARVKAAQRPLLVAGGGVRYSRAEQALRQFAEQHSVPVVETQAGKSSLPAAHALNAGALGVTGVTAANSLARETDLVLAVGTRLQDFTTGSNSLFKSPVIQLNVQPFDAIKYRAQTCIGDAKISLQMLSAQLGQYCSTQPWQQRLQEVKATWVVQQASLLTADPDTTNPSDAQVVAAVNQHVSPTAVVIGAAGSLPAELHKHWQSATVGGYHMEYGYSCMGYEIAAGVGVKLAEPDRQVVVMVGDGSYLMMNSDIATAVSLGLQLTIVVLDNRGFSCINRLQMATGGANFNNLLHDTRHQQLADIDFAGHARCLGAHAEYVPNVGALSTAVQAAGQRQGVSVVVIDTDPMPSSPGDCWWEVEVPEVSDRQQVQQQRETYLAQRLAERGY